MKDKIIIGLCLLVGAIFAAMLVLVIASIMF